MTPQVLVIRVDFSDAPMSKTKDQTEAFFDLVRNYFLENSYGSFQPTFTVTATVHRLGALASFGADCGRDVACRDDELGAATIGAEDAAGRDFSSFDHVMIYHAGAGQETSGIGNDIWSVYFPEEFTVDAKTFDGFTLVPEREAGQVDALGVVCHEYGHQLGLPDLYDVAVAGGASTVGAWDLMDYPYTGTPAGSNPPHLGAWSKSFLGFLSPSESSGLGVWSLYSSNVTTSAIKIPLQTADFPSNEYLLLEYRHTSSTATYDHGIPASGLLIWHIDEEIASDVDRIANNDINTPSLSGRSHRGVDLLEADFTEFYAGGRRTGQETDVFDSVRNAVAPLTNAFNGVASGIAVTNISGVGSDTLQIFIEAPSPTTTNVNGATQLSLSSSGGDLAVDIPAGSLNGTTVLLSSYTATTFNDLGNRSAASNLTPSGVGFILAASGHRVPARPIDASLSFAGRLPLSALSISEMERLVFARYVPDRDLWVPIATTVDIVARTLTARLDHLSVLQVMSAATGATPADVRIFPNPLRPSLGSSYRTMNFTNLPPEAQLQVFTLAGELIRDIRANPSGHATWDGRTSTGTEAASAMYMVVVKDANGQRRKVEKIAIER